MQNQHNSFPDMSFGAPPNWPQHQLLPTAAVPWGQQRSNHPDTTNSNTFRPSGPPSMQSWNTSSMHQQHSTPWNPSAQPPAPTSSAAAPPPSFGYGFGPMAYAQHTSSMPSHNNSYDSSSRTHHMESAVGSSSQWQGNQQYAAAPEAHAAADQDSLKSVTDLPAAFQPLFNFRYFNPVQSECFEVACASDTNMVVSAPTGAGKTGVMELAMVRLLSKHLSSAQAAARSQQQLQPLQRLQGSHKIIYLGPIKALVQERQVDWQARFGQVLGLKVVQLTGDDDTDGQEELESGDVICSTPEKFDQITRKVAEKGSMGFFAEIGLVLLDEVHLLNESGRGSSLEAGCVCRIKAVAAFPEMAKAPIASVRFVAVSATIPNIADIARWLAVPPSGLRQYGDELRPCKLTTHVKGYAPSKNDFLFERRLNDFVYGIIRDYSKGRPALVFCSSRKGTIEAAATIVKEAEAQAQVAAYSGGGGGGPTGSTFVRDMQQLQRLRAAAASTQAKQLAALLVAGVGFHNAAMEPADRSLVEELFKANDLAVLCTTSTLAMGVNLPAHLVVLKGTVRWVGDSEVLPGEQSGYKEYSQTEVLQMVGRAGRPQFDTEGVAVIMTSRDSTSLYQKLLAGQVVESCLLSTLPEHLNAEIVLGTVKDISQAIAWIRSTFLFTRVRANPHHYGLKLKPGSTEAEVDILLRDKIVLKPVQELMKFSLIESDEDNYSLTPTPAGKLMAAHYLKLPTMASIVQLGERPNVPSLLRVICSAEEFKNTSLRRSEKKLLNEINHSKDAEQLRYHVMASKDGNGKVKERISLPVEKLFILLNDALADKPSEGLDYSLKQEQTRLVVVGQRIAKCMAKYYALRESFSSAGRSLLLARSMKARLWEDSKCSVRQLPSVGRQLAARLAAAGFGRLQAVAECGDAHKLEVAAQKPYPWGSELLAALKANTPPSVDISMQVLGQLPAGRGYSCQITLTRTAAAAAAAAPGAAATLAAAIPSSRAGPTYQAAPQHMMQQQAGPEVVEDGRRSMYSTFAPCKLLVGCSSTDDLLLLRSVVLEKFYSPLQVKFRVAVPAGLQQQALTVTAMLLHEKIIGFDQKASMTLQPTSSRQHAAPLGSSWQRSAGSNDVAGSTAAGSQEDLQPDSGGLTDQELQWGHPEGGYDSLQGGTGASDTATQQQQQRQRRKRTREQTASVVAAPAATDGDVDESQAVAGACQGAIQPPAAAPDLGAMLPPAKRACAGLQQQGMPDSSVQLKQRSRGNAHAAGSGMLAPASKVASSSSASAQAAAAPQSSIAARYRSVFSLGAAGLLTSSSSTGTANSADCGSHHQGPNQRNSTGDTAAAAAAGAAAAAAAATDVGAPQGGCVSDAAMDAAELQVTPGITAAGDNKPLMQQGLAQPEPPPAQQAAAAAVAASLRDSEKGQVTDVGQVMSSLFDMLADDEDLEQQQQHVEATRAEQPLLQQQQSHCRQDTGSPSVNPAVSCSATATAAPAAAAGHLMLNAGGNSSSSCGMPWSSCRQPLAQLPSNMGAFADPKPARVVVPTDRASASALFGAAVKKSHVQTAGKVSGALGAAQRQSNEPADSLKSVVSSRTGQHSLGLKQAQRTALPRRPFSSQQQQQQQQGADQGSRRGLVAGGGAFGVRQPTPTQQLVTPPRQIVKSMFAGMAPGAPTAGSIHSSTSTQHLASSHADQQQSAAACSAAGGRDGSTPQTTTGLPDFRQFAFTSGDAAGPSAVQPGPFKPSANAMMFGHLPAGPPHSKVQRGITSGTSSSMMGWQQHDSPAAQPKRPRQSDWASKQDDACAAGPRAEAPWQQFVTGQHPAGGSRMPRALPSGGQALQLPDRWPGNNSSSRSSQLGTAVDDSSEMLQQGGSTGGQQQQQQQQQHVTRKMARAAWQAPAGAVSSAGQIMGNHSSKLLVLDDALPVVDVPPAAQGDDDGHIPPGPALALPPQPPAAPAAGGTGCAEDLDLSDIFSFM